jgi:type IV pilus assembly protein PilC
MAQFSYKARRRTGELVEGVLEVADRSAALVQIERLGLFPIVVDAARGSAVVRPSAARGNGKKPAISGLLPASLRNWSHRQRRPKLQELAMYTQQMANLLHAGMPLTVALHSMTSLSSKGIPSEVSRQLKQDVTEGRSLSDSMARQGGVFPDLVVNIVRAGEQSGALEEVLRRQAAHFERFAEVQARFKSAMIYPAVVCSVGVVLIVFFMTVMLPKFMTLFEGMKVPLPAMTQALINISHFFSGYWWLFPLLGTVFWILFKRYQATPMGRRALDRLKMRLPLFGKVIRLNLFGQFSRTLATLLQNGVPVLQALRITEQIIPNAVVKEAIAATREAVTDGKTLAQPLAKSQIFPQLMIDLIKIGEETGNVPASLNNVADTYEQELNLALRAMTNLIEPIMIVVIAIIVGFLLMSVMSAMFAITNSIQVQR